MNLKNLIVSLTLIVTVLAPSTAMAANEPVSVSKSVSHSNLKNICETTKVEITVKGADREIEIRNKLDVMLIMDHSYSMFEYNDGRMGESQTAAITFISELDPNFDTVGLARFSTTAELQENLSNNFNPAKNTINGYSQDAFSAFTNIEDAIEKGISEIDNNGRNDAVKLMILFSDGGVNRPENNGSEDKPYAKGKALDKAIEAASKDIIIYTVTLGTSNLDIDLMDDIAGATGGKSFVAPNPQDIVDAYLEIASEITDSVASNVKVTDVLNNNFVFVGGSDSPTANITANPDGSKTLKWNVGILKSNQEAKFSYEITPLNKGNNQAIDSHPLSMVEFTDVNGDPQTLTIPTTVISVKSDDCGRGGGDDDSDDEDEDDNDDDNDSDDSDDDEDDARGGIVLGSSTSRMGFLPVTGGFAETILNNKCEDRFEVQLLLLVQSVFHLLASSFKKTRKYQAFVAAFFVAVVYFASSCGISPVLISSIALGTLAIVLSRVVNLSLIHKSR